MRFIAALVYAEGMLQLAKRVTVHQYVWNNQKASVVREQAFLGRQLPLFIPCKAKVSTRRFPYVTAALIVTNVLVFVLTSKFAEVQEGILDKYALCWGTSPPFTLITSQFLHGDVFHLFGNMLFLWVFGEAVEDRLGPVLYVGLYFLTGLAGDAMEITLGRTWAIDPYVYSFGASACISGVLGAYWYLYPWSRVRVLYCVAWLWQGTLELAAIWVIGGWFVLDLCSAFVEGVAGLNSGIGNWAHLGGVLAGVVAVRALHSKRDSREVSMAKANSMDYGSDRHLMDCSELRILVEESPGDEDLLGDYARAALQEHALDDLRFALEKNPRAVVTGCPDVVEYFLVALEEDPSALGPDTLLQMAMWCETHNQPMRALRLYGVIAEQTADSRSVEAALYRSAGIAWSQYADANAAIERLDLLFARFPRGTFVLEAEDLREEVMRQNRLAA